MKYISTIILAFILVLIYQTLRYTGLSEFSSVCISLIAFTVYLFVRYVKIVRIPIPLDDKEEFNPRYFWSGPEGSFFSSTLPDGEVILKLMPTIDQTEWTATKLY